MPYDSDRYKVNDDTIKSVVTDFNANKATRIDATDDQAKQIPDMTFEMFKAWLIQESGGSDARSIAAWLKDPAQVNVPGDWNDYKKDLGLTEPTQRNEGTLEGNMKAALALLARKGFGKSGKAPRLTPSSSFDGWATALRRYNGRSIITANGSSYSQNYSDRIVERANGITAGKETPIELPKPLPPAPAPTSTKPAAAAAAPAQP